MSVFDYQVAIQITFDKEIVSEVDIQDGYNPAKLTSLSSYTPISSGDYYPASRAFDGDTGNYWRSASTTMPQWIGLDFGGDMPVMKIRVYTGSYCPNAYEIQGSDDGVLWDTVKTGSFANTTGWQEIEFDRAVYRYWRLIVTSLYSSRLYIYEMEFFTAVDAYVTAGWTVSGSEYEYQPEGEAIPGEYSVHRVTKTADNLAVILWLEMGDRMRDPAGPVTVTYNKLLGNLIGPYSSQVESFERIFEPTNIVPLSNPYDRENLSAQLGMTVSEFIVTYKYIPAESDTFLIPDPDNPHMDENLSAQTNLILVVTNVGGLPL